MKSSIVIALLCCFFGHAACASPLGVTKVAEGVYVHVGQHLDFDEHYDGDIANIGFIIGNTCVAVIDTGGSLKVGTALRETIRTYTKLPIQFVINTHIHPDHVFGNAAFVQDNPAFIGHANLASGLHANEESMLKALRTELGKDADGSKIIYPTKWVVGAMDIDLGGRVLHLQAWSKAHTGTDITVMDNLTKTLWTGDLLFITRTPSLDGDLKGWIEVIDNLKKLDATVTVPGHGKLTTNKNVELEKEQHYLNALLSDIRQDIKKGRDLQKSIDTAGHSEKNNWVLFDVVNPRNVNLAYPQLEWE